MPLSTQAYMDALISHASSTGYFSAVNGVDIGSTPDNSGLTGVLYVQGVRPIPAGSGLNTTSVVVTFTLRLIRAMNSDPYGSIDADMVEAMDALINAYSGDFTLGGVISYIDLLGEHGTQLESDSGFLKLNEDQTFRIIDITIPCVVHDVWTQEG